MSPGLGIAEITRARITPIRLELVTPLATASGVITSREGFVVELEAHHAAERSRLLNPSSSGDGAVLRGVGEALPLPSFGGEDPSRCRRALERGLRALLDAELSTRRIDALPMLLAGVSEAVEPLLHPVAANALEVALFDLEAREREVPLARLLQAPPWARVAASALLAGEEPSALASAARCATAAGFRCVKLKLGRRTLGEDLARVAAVRDAIGIGIALRLDANGAWSEAEALEAIAALARFEIELLEQPVAAAAIDSLLRVARAARFGIAADESLAHPGASDRLLAEGAVAAFVLKLPLLGGLRSALSLASRARRAGIDCVVTSFLDSSIGVHAAAGLARALAPSDRAAGLATGALLRRDLAPALRIFRGEIEAATEPGLGVAPDERALAALATGPALELAR